MIIKATIYMACLLGISFAAYFAHVDYSYTDLKDYLSILMSVSSMVFTLMGIWIAFLYPNALQRLIDPAKIENADFSESLSETKRLENLVGSILRSAFVVIMIMCIFLAKIIYSQIDIFISNALICKSITLALVTCLSLLQVESVFYVIYSNILFINDLHKKREDREADADI